MIIHKSYSKKYIKLAILCLFLSPFVFGYMSIAGILIFVCSIAGFTHQSGISIDRKSRTLGFYSDFLSYKQWSYFEFNQIHKVTIESKLQIIQSASDIVNDWTVFTYNLVLYKAEDKVAYGYGFTDYKDAKIISDLLSKKYNINVKNYVEEAQIRARTTRKEVDERRRQRLLKR